LLDGTTRPTERLERKETAFLDQLHNYERKWVAILESDGHETIVGAGANAVEAARSAESNGFKDFVLFFVRPFDAGYLPRLEE
jgi:hypothetical protein